GPLNRVAPAVWPKRKVPDARLALKVASVFEPMIEPAEQNRVCIDIRGFTEIRVACSIAPGNMNPRTGDEVLVLARKGAACASAQRAVACNGTFEIGIEPAGNVQRGHTNPIDARADILHAPVLSRFTMRKPISHIIGQRWIGNRRMRRIGSLHRLRTYISPRGLKPVARGT